MTPSQNNINVRYPNLKQKKTMESKYLKMISDAIRNDSQNKGTLRKNIWDFLRENYGEYRLDYRDFLVSIRALLKDGKLENVDGYFKVAPELYREIWYKAPTPNTRSNSVKEPNPFLSVKGRNSLVHNSSNAFIQCS